MNNHEQPERRPEAEESGGAQNRPKSTSEEDRPQPNVVNKRKRPASNNERDQTDLDPDNTD